MKKSRSSKLKLKIFTASQMKRMIDDNWQSVAFENIKIVQACNFVVSCTMLFCIVAAFVIQQFHIVPAYCTVIAIMSIEYVLCNFAMKSKSPEKFARPLIYIFSAVVLIFSGFIIFFVTPPATYVSFIGFLVLISMLFIDRPMHQLFFFGFIVALFTLLEIVINPDPKTQADAILNVIVMPTCSLVLGWYNCGLKLRSFDAERKLMLLNMEDAGTGLANRRCLFADLKKMCDNHEIHGIFMIDVDNFKEYNDSYGHLSGDKCLKSIASLLQEYGETHDIRFYRFGGDEFVGLRRISSDVAIDAAAENMTSIVQNSAIDFSQWREANVSISIGYADTTSCDVEECIRKADVALYHSKRCGKGKAVKYTDT